MRYRLTDEQFKKLMDASKPVRYMVFGGREPSTPRENAENCWRTIAEEIGCQYDTIKDARTGDQHDFEAEAKVTA